MPDRLRDGLPDCQLHSLRARAHTIVLPTKGEARECFCYACGASCGYVWGHVVHVYVLCDACVDTRGHPPGLTPIPDAVARGRA